MRLAGEHPNDEDFIPSLANALATIRLFNSENPEWTLSQIARQLQLTPGSTRRVLRTLEILGYAQSNEGRFRLTARVLDLGFSYLSSLPFSTVARPRMRQLATELGLTCSIAVLDERETVYVARATHTQFEPAYVRVGARFPAYATAPGKVLLAALPQDKLDRLLEGWELEAFTPKTLSNVDALRAELDTVRAQGWAINDQEMFLGNRGLAVPLTIGGAQTAAIIAATTVARISLDGLEKELLPPLRAAADEIQHIAETLL